MLAKCLAGLTNARYSCVVDRQEYVGADSHDVCRPSIRQNMRPLSPPSLSSLCASEEARPCVILYLRSNLHAPSHKSTHRSDIRALVNEKHQLNFRGPSVA